MSTVKNITLEPIDIAGRFALPGVEVGDVNLDDPDVALHLRAGQLVEVDEPRELTAKELVAQIRDADLEIVEAIAAVEEQREQPRSTVLAAAETRRSEIKETSS